jgi:signal transduction histidine kinase
MEKERIIKTKVALVSKFTIIIGISVFITVLFISAYNLYATTPIIKQYKVDKNIQMESISNMLSSSASKEDQLGIVKNETYKVAKSLAENNLILYSALIDNKNAYLWSTVDNLEGNPANFSAMWTDGHFAEKFTNLDPLNIQQNNIKIGNKLLIIAFYKENSIVNLVNLMVNGNLFLSMLFIIFGFVSAFILAKYVTMPIKKLAEGADEFSSGNLSYRTDIKSEDEIGVLANAFNTMAENLYDLYNSLEQKVMDRTHELSKKNLQIKRAYKELKETQSMMVHNEKMRSLGQLVAGVAHELNNPINFIYGNLAHLKNYTNDLVEIITEYEEIQKNLPAENFKQVEKIKEDIDYQFIVEDLASLIKSCTEGAERSKQIILDLKNFSRLDEAMVKEVNIHEGIDSALNILNNKHKGKVSIIKEYGEISQVTCYAGQINQVFMNVIDNAVQAIPHDQGQVTIRTRQENGGIVVVEIEDNGSGIPDEVLPKIFDPFFTTKAVGEGTGLGLSICYKIIKSHNGKMEVESEKGKGTKFIIKIPVEWSPQADSEHENAEESQEESLEE